MRKANTEHLVMHCQCTQIHTCRFHGHASDGIHWVPCLMQQMPRKTSQHRDRSIHQDSLTPTQLLIAQQHKRKTKQHYRERSKEHNES